MITNTPIRVHFAGNRKYAVSEVWIKLLGVRRKWREGLSVENTEKTKSNDQKKRNKTLILLIIDFPKPILLL